MDAREMLERMAKIPEWSGGTTKEQVVQAALRELKKAEKEFAGFDPDGLWIQMMLMDITRLEL